MDEKLPEWLEQCLTEDDRQLIGMAVCAMAEALYEFAQLQDAGGAVQSVSVGNVSENRAAVAAPDTSAAAQAAELYRRAGLYADIYRGC